MTIEEAADFFQDHPRVAPVLVTLCDVGLGYLQLGQWATTLSGGEAQRLKLGTELAKPDQRSTLYVLDEPTAGLHFHDIHQLLVVLRKLVAGGHTVVVVEHDLSLIAQADWIIDLGPEGGARGGRIVAVGSPDSLAVHAESATARALAAIRGND